IIFTPYQEGVVDDLLWLLWGLFATEFLLRLSLTPNKIKYVKKNCPDVLIVALPFIRPLRFFRLLFVLPRAWRHTRSILRKKTLRMIGLMSALTVFLSASFVYVVERDHAGPIDSFADALWWAITTITTVGYGDTYPVTGFGRGVAVILMVTGITLFGLLTANAASFFLEDHKTEHSYLLLNNINDEQKQLAALLTKLNRGAAQRPRFLLAGFKTQLAVKRAALEQARRLQAQKSRNLFKWQ
ncbi:MAG: potassium channel family protein, partial [Vibrionaceae bacterium]